MYFFFQNALYVLSDFQIPSNVKFAEIKLAQIDNGAYSVGCPYVPGLSFRYDKIIN